MKFSVQCAALGLVLILSPNVQAHRGWMLPSATVLSGNNVWVTFDAAISNDLFYFEHNPMQLANLAVFAPDGSLAKVENASTGKYRSTFDVQLIQQGTYKAAVVNDNLFASYKENGVTKRWRGKAENLAKEIPAGAEGLNVTHMQSRLETFVTSGKPTAGVLKPVGKGLELVPVTHPNDLIVGSPVVFRFFLDGKPAGNLKVAVVPGGIRYRDKLNAMEFTTDQDGKISIKWSEPGWYWLNATYPPQPPGSANQEGGAKPQITGTPSQPARRTSYTATFEVLPQ